MVYTNTHSKSAKSQGSTRVRARETSQLALQFGSEDRLSKVVAPAVTPKSKRVRRPTTKRERDPHWAAVWQLTADEWRSVDGATLPGRNATVRHESQNA
jgi:hypothetical protein